MAEASADESVLGPSRKMARCPVHAPAAMQTPAMMHRPQVTLIRCQGGEWLCQGR